MRDLTKQELDQYMAMLQKKDREFTGSDTYEENHNKINAMASEAMARLENNA